MSDFIGCDPHRLRGLADRLERAAEALARGGPAVSRAMAGWGSPLPLGLLIREATRVGEDARAMALRADLALTMDDPIYWGGYEVQFKPEWRAFIPWNPTTAERARHGLDDARRLRDALHDRKRADAHAVIGEVGQSLEDHANDPAYLQAFLNAGGAEQMAGLARYLNGVDGTRDFTPLQPESEKILGQYGTALAAATRMHHDKRITLPDDAFDPILHPKDDDYWSAAMLLKYGPTGDHYDPEFLADLGRNVLDWQQTKNEWPNNADPWDLRAWHYSLRLTNDPLGHQAQYIGAIQKNHPALTVLDRIGESPHAARALLAGDDGPKRAKQLIDDRWMAPDLKLLGAARPVADVLLAAASDRSPAHAELSATAAANMFQAASDSYFAEPKHSSSNKPIFPALPPSTTQALAIIASAHVLGLARSTRLTGTVTGPDRAEDGNWSVLANNIVVSGLLHQIMREPTAAGGFRGTVDANITTATIARAEMHGDVPADLNRLGQLQGFIELVNADLGSDAAKEEDVANTRAQTYFESVTGALGAVPGGRALGWTQTAIGFAAPIGKDQIFPTDNAEKFEAGSQRDMYVALNGMRPQIAQGLIAAGKVHPPTDAPWIGPDGQINLSDPDDRMRFDGWWERLLANWTEYEGYAQDGFQNATMPSASNDDAHRRHSRK